MMNQPSFVRPHIIGVLCVWVLTLASCGDPNMRTLPDELKLSKAIFETTDTNTFGPGGLNETLIVFQLSSDVTNQVAQGGIDYLNTLPSMRARANRPDAQPSSSPWTGPFANWRKGIVPTDNSAWYRFGRIPRADNSDAITGFFQDADFVATITQQHMDELRSAITSPESYYAYGGYRGQTLLVLDLTNARAYHLYRD